MEKAILKTLIYADIFDYPLKSYEIHKWLIGMQATLRQVETALKRLTKKSKTENKRGYYFLSDKERLVKKREEKEKQSKKFLWKAKFASWFLKFIPTLRLIGISGGLALNNAGSKDDIDLFLITSNNRLWISRLLVIFILDFWGMRRKVKMSKEQAAGKLCPNILLEEDKLEQKNKDLFTAHEVLQMRVLFSRGGVYKKYLEDNAWVFKFLPNWTNGQNVQGKMYNIRNKRKKNSKLYIVNFTFDLLERLSRRFQLWYMEEPKGLERIQDGALYFHPNDIRPQILGTYRETQKN